MHWHSRRWPSPPEDRHRPSSLIFLTSLPAAQLRFAPLGPGGSIGPLCGTSQVELFNLWPSCVHLTLKPCCLPPLLHARRCEVFEGGAHRFPACQATRFPSACAPFLVDQSATTLASYPVRRPRSEELWGESRRPATLLRQLSCGNSPTTTLLRSTAKPRDVHVRFASTANGEKTAGRAVQAWLRLSENLKAGRRT